MLAPWRNHATLHCTLCVTTPPSAVLHRKFAPWAAAVHVDAMQSEAAHVVAVRVAVPPDALPTCLPVPRRSVAGMTADFPPFSEPPPLLRNGRRPQRRPRLRAKAKWLRAVMRRVTSQAARDPLPVRPSTGTRAASRHNKHSCSAAEMDPHLWLSRIRRSECDGMPCHTHAVHNTVALFVAPGRECRLA